MNVLEELVQSRNRVAEEIDELLSMRDSVNCDIAERRERLLELNKDIEETKEEEAKEAKEKEERYLEALELGDYSTLARVYRRLNKAICEGRKRGWYTFMENTSYPSEGELRQQRRAVGDRMLDGGWKMSEEEKMREFKSGDGRSKRLWELDNAISEVKKKIAEYEAAVVKGKTIIEELEARRARLLSGQTEVDGE